MKLYLSCIYDHTQPLGGGTVFQLSSAHSDQILMKLSLLCDHPQNSADAGVIDQLMSSLDENNDGELTFSEFWQLIGKLASKQGGFSQ